MENLLFVPRVVNVSWHFSRYNREKWNGIHFRGAGSRSECCSLDGTKRTRVTRHYIAVLSWFSCVRSAFHGIQCPCSTVKFKPQSCTLVEGYGFFENSTIRGTARATGDKTGASIEKNPLPRSRVTRRILTGSYCRRAAKPYWLYYGPISIILGFVVTPWETSFSLLSSFTGLFLTWNRMFRPRSSIRNMVRTRPERSTNNFLEQSRVNSNSDAFPQFIVYIVYSLAACVKSSHGPRTGDRYPN